MDYESSDASCEAVVGYVQADGSAFGECTESSDLRSDAALSYVPVSSD